MKDDFVTLLVNMNDEDGYQVALELARRDQKLFTELAWGVMREEEYDWRNEAKQLCRQNRKIAAIKLTREKAGMSLKEAKDLVESWGIQPLPDYS